jgi:hypothetical protein
LPSEANLTPHAAERLCREAARKSFDDSAKSLNRDWKSDLDGKQIQRWSEALGRGMVKQRDRQSQQQREGRYVQGPLNAPKLLVIGLDGGRYQSREKDPDTNSRWREDKVVSVSSYLPGDGKEGSGARAPAPLVTTHLATAHDAGELGVMARVEAERRGYRQAQEVIGMGDGGNWIDPLFDREFRLAASLAVGRQSRKGHRRTNRSLHETRRPAIQRSAWASKTRTAPKRRLLHPAQGTHAISGISRQRLADRIGRDRSRRKAIQPTGERH